MPPDDLRGRIGHHRNRTRDMPEKTAAKGRSSTGSRSGAPKGRGLRGDVQEFKRDLILRTATEIFFEKGFQGTTVDEIAAAMSVSKAVVYGNFSSKNEVLDGIVDRAMAKLTQCVQYIDPDRRPAQNLAEVCFRHSATILTNQKEVAVYLFEQRHRSPGLARRVKSQQARVVEALVGLLEAGRRSDEFRIDDPELVVYDILSMIAMSFDWRWHQNTQRHSPQSLSLHFAEQALRLAGHVGEFPFRDGELAIEAGERVLDRERR
jgi:AcrR family transcriptional regulator